MPFEIPEDLGVLDDAALADSLEQALAEAAEFDEVPDDELDDEKLSRLLALADFATAARAEQGSRENARAERAERAAAARATLAGPPEEPAPTEDVVDAEIVEETEEKKPEPVAASARKVPVVTRIASKAPVPVDVAPAKPAALLTASADVPGFPTGGPLKDLDTVGSAVVARMKGLPTSRLGGEGGVQMRYAVAQIDIGSSRTDGLVQSPTVSDQTLVKRASQESRLPGGSLVAAGGWCAPSETLYDLCVTESTDGLLDLPSVTANRGGLRFTKGPSFQDIYTADGLGWNLTEAQVIAGTPEKTCVEIECPPFEEVRLNAIGLCVRAPLLTQAAYPELVRRWIEGVLVAHQHKIDAWLLAQIDAGSDAISVTGDAANTIDSLAQLEMIANYQRQQWRSSFSQTFEVLAPVWYKTVVRADLARRTGIDLINVSDAQITSYFAARQLRVQWLANLSPLVATGGVITIPDEVTVYVFPSGTWVKATTDVISLDAVYDSQTLLQNAFTALFAEEGAAVVNTCWDSVKATISTCSSGRTGAADITDCLFAAAVTP